MGGYDGNECVGCGGSAEGMVTSWMTWWQCKQYVGRMRMRRKWCTWCFMARSFLFRITYIWLTKNLFQIFVSHKYNFGNMPSSTIQYTLLHDHTL